MESLQPPPTPAWKAVVSVNLAGCGPQLSHGWVLLPTHSHATSDSSDTSSALLPQETESLIFHGARDPDALIAWFLQGWPSLVKVNPRGATLGCLQVSVGYFCEKSWQCKRLQQRVFFFVTLATFLFWADSSFYLFAAFGYHVFFIAEWTSSDATTSGE